MSVIINYKKCKYNHSESHPSCKFTGNDPTCLKVNDIKAWIQNHNYNNEDVVCFIKYLGKDNNTYIVKHVLNGIESDQLGELYVLQNNSLIKTDYLLQYKIVDNYYKYQLGNSTGINPKDYYIKDDSQNIELDTIITFKDNIQYIQHTPIEVEEEEDEASSQSLDDDELETTVDDPILFEDEDEEESEENY